MTSSLVGSGDVYKRQRKRCRPLPPVTTAHIVSTTARSNPKAKQEVPTTCLLYTSDAADDM
eukprot:7069995-Prorocentrum_lima.AAC.1